MHLATGYGFRNQSVHSRRTSDYLMKNDFRKLNLKLSNSKTTLELCPTQRSESQANQTINNLALSQDLQSPGLSQFHIKAFIRFRPLKIGQQYSPKENTNNKKIAIIDKRKILCQDNFFTYDQVFQTSSQQTEIYNNVCKQMVEHFVRGFNSTVFTYGQTGSGKTYTMFGDINQQKRKGIIPSAIKDIFSSIQSISKQSQNGQNNQVIISCSMLEIYKQVMIDLLTIQKADLKIKQNQFFNVSNLTIKQVASQIQMADVLKIGNQSKKMRQTNMNQASSRSHVIFTIYLEVRKQHQKRLSKFNLVDLAGSQKVSKSKVDGQGLQQAKKINLSLSCLGNTINALLKRNDHIPYRESKLTRLLYESLGGNSLTRLIVTCSSQQTQIQQTLSSLKFASRAKNLKTNPLINTLRKSQKSVSRIAYENLKTNLNKAQYKIKNIKKFLSELKNQLDHQQSQLNAHKNKSIEENKQNYSIYSNKEVLENEKQMLIKKQVKMIQSYKKFVSNLQNVLLSTNLPAYEGLVLKDDKKQAQTRTKYNQSLLNPFILISQSKQKQLKVPSLKLQQNSKQQSDKKNKIHILLKNNGVKEQNGSYWSIIKKQEKQIDNLRKKLDKLQRETLSNVKQQQYTTKIKDQLSLNSTQPFSTIQSRKNSHMIDLQSADSYELKQAKIDENKKNCRKLNIKITGKALPVRQIFLTSPTNSIRNINKTLLNSKQKQTYNRARNSKQSLQNSKQQVKYKNKEQRLYSPRQFVPTQYKQQIQQNAIVQNLLKQVCKKLQHKNQYERFQKNILLRQLELLIDRQTKNIEKQKVIEKKTLNNQPQAQSLNLNQLNDTNYLSKKITLEETNQLLIAQTRYIEQLETLVLHSCKKDSSSVNKSAIKEKLNLIKLR